MTESRFNGENYIRISREEEIPLQRGSGRYSFYKTKRAGLLQFVKKPLPEFADDIKTIEALRKEFLLGYPLSHPAIVRYIDFSDNALYEEFIDGETLDDMLSANDTRLKDPRFIDKIARQLLEALDYIHSHGILHLDIKPENIIITRIGDNLKLIDFSCAESSGCNDTSGFTPGYKAPEQGTGATDCTTDIYLAGKVIGTLARNAGVASSWKKFIGKATAEETSDRFQTAREALNALPSPSSRKYRLLLYWLAAFIILIGAVVAVILLPRSDFSSSEESVVATGTLPAGDTLQSSIPEADVATATAISMSNDTLKTSPPAPTAIKEPPSYAPPAVKAKESPATPTPAPAPAAADFSDRIYIVGNVENNMMFPDEGIAIQGSKGIFSGVFNFTPSTKDDWSYFCFTERLSDSWDTVGTRWANRGKASDGSQNFEINGDTRGKYALKEDYNYSFKVKPGKYYIELDLNSKSVTIKPYSR